LLRAGVRILTDDLKHVAFNTPRGVSALALFADMFQKDRSITPGFLAYSHSEINDLFSGNKVAMSIEGPWFQSMVSGKSPGKQIYTVPVPVPDDLEGEYDTLPTLQDMVMYPINARTEHPAAAWEFVKFLRNEEADMNWVVKDLGGIATTLRALNSLETAKREDWGVYKHELERAIPWPPHPSINNIARNAITPPCEKAVVGELTPAEGLKQAALDAQAILDGKK
jgi:ABC-type glycerol-3-phosphate transport system substrate-binding protein